MLVGLILCFIVLMSKTIRGTAQQQRIAFKLLGLLMRRVDTAFPIHGDRSFQAGQGSVKTGDKEIED